MKMKDIGIVELLDCYRNLLTPHQALVMSLYYEEDFSLAEISSETGASRQAVRDTIKRSEGLLTDYESKMKLAERQSVIENRISGIVDDFKKEISESKSVDLENEAETLKNSLIDALYFNEN